MHDAAHEERCLLLQAGELAPEEARRFQAESHACPACREFLASLAMTSAAARRAAVAPPAGLDAQVLGRAVPARVWRPRWPRISLGLAAAAAALALVVLPVRERSEDLHWANGIERDIARMDQDLDEISRSLTAVSDSYEIDAGLSHVEEMAQSLKRQTR